MTQNPYSSSAAPPSPEVLAATNDTVRSLSTIARETYLAWEKLRIAYVALLAMLTVILIGLSGSLNRPILVLIVKGAFFANIAFFAGPTIETYVKWLGYDRAWPRWFMFVGGTVLSIVLAVAVLATELLPDQD